MKRNIFKIFILLLFNFIFLVVAFTDTNSGNTYTDPSTGITHYYNNSGKLIGSSFVGEHGLEVHAKKGENIYVFDNTQTEEPTKDSQKKVIPRTEYEARSRKFPKPQYVDTPIGNYKVRSVEYNSDGTLKTLTPAEKITLTIPQGKVTAFGTVTFGLYNKPLLIELPDTLTWDKQPKNVKIKTKIFFWENGTIKQFSTYYPTIEIQTPLGVFCSDSSIDFYDNGMFKRFAFNSWEEIKTPVGNFMIGAVGFNKQGVPTYFKFSENNDFKINGVSYKKNVTLKISESGKVMGYYNWDTKTREWIEK